MATDFAVALRRFLTSYLAGLRGCSPATIASYRDTFKLLIVWFRNQRLAAISSFATWMQNEDPARMACWQDIIAIPSKKQDRPAVRHLTAGQARLLLARPDRSPVRKIWGTSPRCPGGGVLAAAGAERRAGAQSRARRDPRPARPHRRPARPAPRHPS
jgi:hypothetical protein